MVKENTRGPAFDGAAVRPGLLGPAIEEDGGTRGAESSEEGLPGVLGDAPQEEHLLPAAIEAVPPPAAIFSHRCLGGAVLDREGPRAGPDPDRCADEMPRSQVLYPAVFHVVESDADPGVLLVFWACPIELADTGQVLHSHLADPVRPGQRLNRAATGGEFEGAGERRVEEK